ncbi:hypothetical protein Ancab_023856 [Ancistrocladus abbreviatus]
MECIPKITKFMINKTRVKVLECADIIAGYVIKLFIVYLTQPWYVGGKSKNSTPVTTLPYIVAAAFVNVFWGLVYMLPIVFSHIQRASPMAEFNLLCCSSLSYCAGLGLLLLSSSKEGMKKPAAFYVSLPLLAAGIAGQVTARESFEEKLRLAGQATKSVEKKPRVAGQATTRESDEEKARAHCNSMCNKCEECCHKVVAVVVTYGLKVGAFLVVQMGGTMIAYIHSWQIKYGIAAACMVAALLVFLTGICCCEYENGEAQESNPLKSQINFVPSLSACFPSCCGDGEEEKSTTRSETQKDKDAEITVHLTPMFLTFIMCGVVCSTAYTTLLAQAATLKNRASLSFLLFFYSVGKAVVTLCYEAVCWFLRSDKTKSKQRFAPTFGIGFAMLFSVLTSIVAATVEAKMQESLSMWWLLPQSVFVGVLDGIYQVSIKSFFVDGLSSTRKEDISIFAKAVFGAGFMGNALLVFILSRTAKWIPGTTKWITNGSSTSGSELEKYYWLLAVLSGIALTVYILIAIWFNHKHRLTASSSSSSPSPSVVNKPSQAIEE